jgi:hypothetical protein
MPTIRAKYPVTVQAEVVISRDFSLNREKQLAQALWEALQDMGEEEAVDYLAERMNVLSEGEPCVQGASGGG